MKDQVEIWKDIENYVGFYQISNFGNVKSLKRTIFKSNSIHTVKEKFLKQCIGSNGYYLVSLRKYNSIKSFSVHRLVAEYFIKQESNKPIINHLDGNKLNNNVTNLEWCTYSENIFHALEHNLMISLKGEQKPLSKLSDNDVLEIRKLKGIMTQKDIAKIYNIDSSNICRILNRKSWTHI